MKKEIPRNGLHTEYYDSGQTRVELNYKDGNQDGKWTRWYENGQIEAEEKYKDGKLNGKWTRWYENGQKRYENNYKDGERNGKSTWWYENGQKRYSDNYKDGKQVTRIQWSENGHIEETGAEVEYYPDGQIKSKYVQYDSYAARFSSYYSNGNIETLGEYVPGTDFGDREIDDYSMAAARPPEKQGWWNYWYETGQIRAQCHYDLGAINGLYIGFYKNGQKKIEKTYKAVEDEGKEWDPYEIYRRDLSIKNGIAVIYRRDGSKKLELNYKDGKKNGKCREWDKNGQLVSEVDIIVDRIKQKKDDLDQAW